MSVSGQKYELLLKVDDSPLRELVTKFEGIFGKNTLMGKLNSFMGGGKSGDDSKKSLLKIGLLVGGVTAIVGILKRLSGLILESSPMLQQMLKLLNFGIMLIFRPIGDFIGFFLRPILVMLLRNVIIPFYQQFMPIAKTLGTWLGNQFTKDISEDPVKTALKYGLLGDFGKLFAYKDEILEAFKKLGSTFISGVSSTWDSYVRGGTYVWQQIINIFVDTYSTIKSGLGESIGELVRWFRRLYGRVSVPIGNAFDNIVSFFTKLYNERIKMPLEYVWNSIVNFFLDLWQSIVNGIQPLIDFFNGFSNFDPFAGIQQGANDLGQSISSGAEQAVNSLELNVGNIVNGMDLNGLKDTIFGWFEDINSRR